MNILVYGSLRKNGWLHNHWMGLNPVSTIIIPNHNLYAITSQYPAATEGDNDLICELYDVEPEHFQSIKVMEENAGYYEKSIQIENGKASIFLQKAERIRDSAELVKHGDWIKYYNKK